MTAYVTLEIEIHTLYDDIETALWCDHCQLPSTIAVPTLIVNARTLHILDRTMLHVCQDCGRHRYEPMP